jgi:prolyl-tRNA editing enzyme YbaK/EbsC (Cys-tRNA(Pro) deacylase)
MREKVISTARRLGLDVRVASTSHPARTVDAAASAVGCDQARIARSEVFVADGDPVVVVTPGTHRVDLDRLCGLLDCAEARPASPAEVRAVTGFPPGGVCPFGHDLPVILDDAVLEQERVWTLGGDSNTLVEFPTRELAERLGATVGSIAARNGTGASPAERSSRG